MGSTLFLERWFSQWGAVFVSYKAHFLCVAIFYSHCFLYYCDIMSTERICPLWAIDFLKD